MNRWLPCVMLSMGVAAALPAAADPDNTLIPVSRLPASVRGLLPSTPQGYRRHAPTASKLRIRRGTRWTLRQQFARAGDHGRSQYPRRLEVVIFQLPSSSTACGEVRDYRSPLGHAVPPRWEPKALGTVPVRADEVWSTRDVNSTSYGLVARVGRMVLHANADSRGSRSLDDQDIAVANRTMAAMISRIKGRAQTK